MKTCQLTEEFFAIFGIIPHKFIRKRPFNERGILMLLLHSIHILSYSLFMFRVAETFEQCNAAIFMITSAISASNVYITCLWKSVVYFKCIKFIDDTINKSENFFLILWLKYIYKLVEIFTGLAYPLSESIYKTFNKYVETFSEFMYIGLVKMVPICSMSPLLIISYHSYYITDLGRDAFVLPFPMW